MSARALALAALVALALAPAAAARLSPAQLLARYQPVTVLHPLEQFPPVAVDSFVAASVLERRTAEGWVAVGPVATVAALPVVDPPGCITREGAPCWRLNHTACTPAAGIPSLACYADAEAARPAPSVVYGRVVELPSRVVLQYWYWYAYNLWSAEFPPSEYLWQAHEGDWELVSVVLTRAGKPQFAAYSQHCNGRRRAWARVPRWRGTHPVAHVALGSHANFFAAGALRIDTSCYPRIAVSLFRGYHLTPLDYTGRGRALGPAGAGEPTRIVRVTERAPAWMRYAGTWGEDQFFHAPEPVGTVPFGTAPDGPAFHELWRRPLAVPLGWPTG